MKKNKLNRLAIISFIAAAVTFVIGIIMLFPTAGYYQTESDFIEATPFWLLSVGFMLSGIGWLILERLTCDE